MFKKTLIKTVIIILYINSIDSEVSGPELPFILQEKNVVNSLNDAT